jgi:S1-C subfamily serine protease
MMRALRNCIVLLSLAALSSVGLAQTPKVAVPAVVKPTTIATAVKPKEVSLVRVNVTGQPYDYTRPWQKKAPFSKRALGAVLSKGRVLVTADLVANQNYVELERAETGEKSAAEVVVVDYEANLALVRPTDEKFLAGLVPLQLALDTVVGDRLAALQLEPTGALVVTEGLVTTVQMTRYPADVGQFLTYRISMSKQDRDNSYKIPLVKGMMKRTLLDLAGRAGHVHRAAAE